MGLDWVVKMQKVAFDLEILYSQIAVFSQGMVDPFNDWNDVHVSQGFSWRPGSVSFGTFNDSGKCKINVSMADQITPIEEASRIIIVPFEVTNNGVEVASIIESINVHVPNGIYELAFSGISQNDVDVYNLVFVRSSSPKARILLVDEDLSPPKVLLMDANPAV